MAFNQTDPFAGIYLPPAAVLPKQENPPWDSPDTIQAIDSLSEIPIVQEVQPSGGTTSNYPFTPSISGTSLTLTTGTVNGLVPTNIGSTLTIVGTGTEYLQLSISAANAQITSSSFSVSSTAPSVIPVIQGQPPTSFDFCTHVIVNGTAFRVIGNGSLVFTPYEAWRFAKAMPTPDSMPYDSYYSWRAGLT